MTFEIPEDFDFPDGIDMDEETGTFTITIPETVEGGKGLYHTSPVFHSFVYKLIQTSIKAQTGEEKPQIQPYTVEGFLWQHSGETFEEVDLNGF